MRLALFIEHARHPASAFLIGFMRGECADSSN